VSREYSQAICPSHNARRSYQQHEGCILLLSRIVVVGGRCAQLRKEKTNFARCIFDRLIRGCAASRDPAEATSPVSHIPVQLHFHLRPGVASYRLFASHTPRRPDEKLPIKCDKTSEVLRNIRCMLFQSYLLANTQDYITHGRR
jgi:hypothetical protein